MKRQLILAYRGTGSPGAGGKPLDHLLQRWGSSKSGIDRRGRNDKTEQLEGRPLLGSTALMDLIPLVTFFIGGIQLILIVAVRTPRAYTEVVEFIASGSTPSDVIEFRPSEATRRRVSELLEAEKEGPLPDDEKLELDQYFQLEHVMRLAKARARQIVADESLHR